MLFCFVLFCLFFSLICTKTKIPYQCALPRVVIICGIVAHAPLLKGFFPPQAFGDTFVNVTFMSALVSQFQHLDLNRKLAVPQTGVVSIVLCGQWQCYSELCRCLQYQYLGCCCIFFSIYLESSFTPTPRYMKICNTCLYHVEKLSDCSFSFLFFFFFLFDQSQCAAFDAVWGRCLSLYLLWFWCTGKKGSS